MCFVFIWEQTATCATYNTNWLVFITEMKSVYSAVRTGSLNKAVCASSLTFYSLLVTWCTNRSNISTTAHSAHTVFMCFVFIWEQTATCATYSTNWLVFITEMKSVYSAVPTGSLNKAVCASCVSVNAFPDRHSWLVLGSNGRYHSRRTVHSFFLSLKMFHGGWRNFSGRHPAFIPSALSLQTIS